MPSGAEVLRQIKTRIDEVDPAVVREQVSNGATVVDVREPEEWAAGHIPGAVHVPKSYLESRIEGADFYGADLDAGSSFALVNNVFSGNGTVGVQIESGSSGGLFQFNTVAFNGTAGAGGGMAEGYGGRTQCR